MQPFTHVKLATASSARGCLCKNTLSASPARSWQKSRSRTNGTRRPPRGAKLSNLTHVPVNGQGRFTKIESRVCPNSLARDTCRYDPACPGPGKGQDRQGHPQNARHPGNLLVSNVFRVGREHHVGTGIIVYRCGGGGELVRRHLPQRHMAVEEKVRIRAFPTEVIVIRPQF